MDREALYRDERILAVSIGFKHMNKQEFIRIAGDQSRLLQADKEMALNALATLIATPDERKAALAMVREIIPKGSPITKKQQAVLSRITQVLQRK